MTIAEIGVDQVIVDEMQEFRKLTFTTNQSTLKGVDPDGSQRAWDLYVKVQFLGSKRAPLRALIAASGTPITNTLGEMFTIQRFFQSEMLAERGIQEFDAWAAAFGETTTDLGPRRIGAIGGFDLSLGRDSFGWPALLIALTGRDEAVRCENDLTPLGLVSRLEHALTRFEANLGEMSGMIAQAETSTRRSDRASACRSRFRASSTTSSPSLPRSTRLSRPRPRTPTPIRSPKRPDPFLHQSKRKSPCFPQRSRAP